LCAATGLVFIAGVTPVHAEGTPAMPATEAAASLKVSVGGLTADDRLPVSAVYCPPTKMDPAEYNMSPSVSWSRGPAATRSYALMMTDLDVPQDLSLINKPRVTITAATPRVPRIHWVLIDIPPSITSLRGAEESPGFVLKGKPVRANRPRCAWRQGALGIVVPDTFLHRDKIYADSGVVDNAMARHFADFTEYLGQGSA
jgi:phosphatidylethanolamine-binding protein (PEBP) family uncharacterized protein